MNYRKKKEQEEKKIKKAKRICVCIGAVLLVALSAFSAFYPPKTWKYYVNMPALGKRADGEARIHFLGVGQGDSTLIELPDGKVVLIDGGNGTQEAANAVLRHLNGLKIDTIDYLVVTHADGDHCGALDLVLEYKTVLNAYLPAVSIEELDTEYAEFYAALLKEEGCTKQYSARSISLSNTDGAFPYTLQFLYPYTLDAEEEDVEENAKKDGNLLSSVLWFDYRGMSALFTGDAPASTEEKLVWADEKGLLSPYGVDLTSTEILKVSHHGSNTATSLSFLEYLRTKTAVISCGKNNSYGHPSEEVLQNLAAVGATAYRTDTLGTIVVSIQSNGVYGVSVSN